MDKAREKEETNSCLQTSQLDFENISQSAFVSLPVSPAKNSFIVSTLKPKLVRLNCCKQDGRSRVN